MPNFKMSVDHRAAVLVFTLVAVVSCGRDTTSSFPRPNEPLDLSLYDLVDGPIDRASALNVVAGRGRGFPRTVRVDQAEQWDVAFGVLDGESVWLPRGFFEGLEPSSGILAAPVDFEDASQAPENKDLYEIREPIPMTVGETYMIRSRSDPTLSLPCRIFAKVVVQGIQQDLARMDFRIVWNPNCDKRELTLEQAQ
jgi:hypothetical protein